MNIQAAAGSRKMPLCGPHIVAVTDCSSCHYTDCPNNQRRAHFRDSHLPLAPALDSKPNRASGSRDGCVAFVLISLMYLFVDDLQAPLVVRLFSGSAASPVEFESPCRIAACLGPDNAPHRG
jgi:hypothetical protein